MNSSKSFNLADFNNVIAVIDASGQCVYSVYALERLSEEDKLSFEEITRLSKSCIKEGYIRNSIEFDRKKLIVVPLSIKGQELAFLVEESGQLEHLNKQQRGLLERLKTVAETSDVVTTLYNVSGAPEYISPVAEKIFGYSPDEMMSLPSYHGINEDFRPDYFNYVDEVKTGKIRPDGLEFKYTKKNGKEVWLKIRLNPVYDENGDITHIQSTTRDISLRKQYELELEDTKANALAILNASDSALLLIDKKYTAISVNDRAKVLSLQLFGQPVGKGSDVLSIIPETWHENFTSRYLKALDGQSSVIDQKMRIGPDKKAYWFQFKYTPVWLADGSIHAVSWTATDISDQKKTENYTVELLQRLNLANTAAEIGIWEYDFKTDLVKFDDTCIWLFENKIGVRVSSTVWFNKYITKARSQLQKFINPDISKGRSDFDLVLQLKEAGQKIEYHKVKGRIQFYKDQPSKAVGVLMDFSETRRFEEKLEQSHFKLHMAQKMAKLGGFEYDMRKNSMEWSQNTFNIHGMRFHKEPRLASYIRKVHVDDRDEFIKLIRKTGRTNESLQLTYRYEVNGVEHTFNAIVRSHFYRNRLQKVIGTIQDITDNISLKDALEKQKAELDESSRRMSSYSFVNSHKLRAPLSNILGLIQILRIDPSEEMFDMLERSAEDLDKVIHEINEILAD